MTKRLTLATVPCVSRKRAKFPTLDKILDGFVSDNNLPSPKTVVSTDSRGLIVSFGNGDLVNLYSSSEDLNTHYSENYGLQGRIDGSQVNLIGAIRIPSQEEWQGEKLKRETVRYDECLEYTFLGVDLKR